MHQRQIVGPLATQLFESGNRGGEFAVEDLRGRRLQVLREADAILRQLGAPGIRPVRLAGRADASAVLGVIAPAESLIGGSQQPNRVAIAWMLGQKRSRIGGLRGLLLLQREPGETDPAAGICRIERRGLLERRLRVRLGRLRSARARDATERARTSVERDRPIDGRQRVFEPPGPSVRDGEAIPGRGESGIGGGRPLVCTSRVAGETVGFTGHAEREPVDDAAGRCWRVEARS